VANPSSPMPQFSDFPLIFRGRQSDSLSATL